MNRADKIFIGIVLIASCVLLLSTRTLAEKISTGQAYAVVTYRDKEILRINMDTDDFYTVQGDLGDIVIEVSDGRIRVAEEISPLNYCSLQGWVERTNVPIVCLPNRVVIVLYNDNATGEDITIR